MEPASNAKIIRKYMIVFDEYDDPQGFVRVSVVNGKQNVEDKEATSTILVDQVVQFIESVANSLREEEPEEKDAHTPTRH